MPTPRVYFDMCALKRGWDDQTQLRVRLETEAVDALLQLARKGKLQVVRSPIHDIENSTNRNADRRAAVEEFLGESPTHPFDHDRMDAIAAQLAALGFFGLDAAHLAAAEALGAALFVTTDDRLIRRGRRSGLGVRVTGPIQCAIEAAK